MKNHFLLIVLGLSTITLSTTTTSAQDPRERTYYYEILEPKHAEKPVLETPANDRVTEALNRGLATSLATDGASVYLSWRLLANDPANAAFHVYRTVNGKAKRLTNKPITATTDFIDKAPVAEATYQIEVVAPKQSHHPQGNTSASTNKTSNSANKAPASANQASNSLNVNLKTLKTTPYQSIRLNPQTMPGKLALADLNGDGTYDFVVRTPNSNVDPGMPGNLTGLTYKLEAYLNDGTHLWTKELGLGIVPGVWYSPFICYDFNGDGKAEVALKSAPDGVTRNEQGRVVDGDEYLTVLDGMTGNQLAQMDWPERNARYGDLNRQSRNQIGVAYLDGRTPYILAARGTYKLMTVDAWRLEGSKLVRVWRWDGDEENPVVRSQGAHNMICTDIDGDGRDEVVLGSCALDDNGTLLWSVGLGHPDKIYITDINPNREGMEMFLCLEPYHTNGRGVCLIDPKNGSPIWNIGHDTYHVGSGMVTDFDPSHPGLECFASEDKKGGSSAKYLLSADGKRIGGTDAQPTGNNGVQPIGNTGAQYMGSDEAVPPTGNWVWWDADKLREVITMATPPQGAPQTQPTAQDRPLPQTTQGQQTPQRQPGQRFRWASQVGKWKGQAMTDNLEGSVLFTADLDGDWREEIITALPGELRIYRSNIPATDRRITLMQDALYRNHIAHRSMGYDQAPVPSYYLGE